MARQEFPQDYFVNQHSVTPYHPANHAGTSNYRLTGPETADANHIRCAGQVGAAVHLVAQVSLFENAWPACGLGTHLSTSIPGNWRA
jgi:hypothetical protein